MACLFCQIVEKQIPAQPVYQDQDVLAFADIAPIAPVHILIIPKKHISNLEEIKADETCLMDKLTKAALIIARENKLNQNGYRIIINTKKDAGQVVDHLHLHLIGGRPLGKIICQKQERGE